MRRMWISALIVGAFASPSAGQGQIVLPQERQLAEKVVAAERVQKVEGEVRARMAVEARVTTGAPYSAEAVTETTQTLADGNRINRRSVTRVYRDGEGRTRREEIDDAGAVVSVLIVDPVAHLSYVLQPSSRTAYRESVLLAMPTIVRPKIEAARASADGEPAAKIAEKLEAEIRARRSVEESQIPPPPPPAPPAARTIPPTPPPAPLERERGVFPRSSGGAVADEDLGRQNIEGVSATGSRSTTTIAAGAIGNLQPIKIVAEQWFSQDLQVLVMTKHSDPRSGETTYRLQGIVRAEPDRSLFTVPSDYTLRESGIRRPAVK